MSDKYDVERMLNRLVEDEEESNDPEKAVYSWQRDKDYRDKKTDDLSVDDIISTIGTTRRGKHEAVRKRSSVSPVRSDSGGHSIKQKIVYRSPQEIQEEVDKQDNVDSKEYLNRMLDRMEKEIAAMESPLKPKAVRTSENSASNVQPVPKKEKNVIKVKIKKKEEPENIQSDYIFDENEDVIEEKTEKTPEIRENIENNVPKNLQEKPEIESVPKEINIDSDEFESEDLYSDENIENYDSLDEENVRIEQELKDFSNDLLSDVDDFEDSDSAETEVKEKKKGLFSRLFSKKKKSENKPEPENKSDEDGLYDFDEEEFNQKFDELSRQAEELQKDYSEEITEPEDMSEDDYFFDKEEPENIEISDTAETAALNDADEKTEGTEEENTEITEENEPEEDFMDESRLHEYDVTESTEKSDDDEKVFIESVKKDEREIVSDKKLKQKRYLYFGVVVSVFAVVGLVTVVYTAGGALLDGVRGSSVKNQISKKIYPMVVEDASPFDDISECSDTDVIGAAVVNILMNDDTSKYSKDTDICTIPSADVEKSAAEIYGSDVRIKEHQNVIIGNVTLYYDKVTGVYSVPAKPLIYTSKPYISKVTSNGDTYTAQVLYITDYPDWLEKKSDGRSYYTKICDYTLKRSSDKKFYVVSVKDENS